MNTEEDSIKNMFQTHFPKATNGGALLLQLDLLYSVLRPREGETLFEAASRLRAELIATQGELSKAEVSQAEVSQAEVSQAEVSQAKVSQGYRRPLSEVAKDAEAYLLKKKGVQDRESLRVRLQARIDETIPDALERVFSERKEEMRALRYLDAPPSFSSQCEGAACADPVEEKIFAKHLADHLGMSTENMSDIAVESAVSNEAQRLIKVERGTQEMLADFVAAPHAQRLIDARTRMSYLLAKK